MAEQIVSPGVFQRETDQSFITPAPVEVGAAILGPTVRGPVEQPTVVTSFADYKNKFGTTFISASENLEFFTSIAAQKFFSNGGNSFSSLSDERIKENLIEITGATEKLNQLRCINYNYTFDKEREHLGLIAQEVQKFYPQIVSGDPSKEIEEIVNEDGIVYRKNVMSIEYSSLIPVLVKSIQELTKRIEELEK